MFKLIIILAVTVCLCIAVTLLQPKWYRQAQSVLLILMTTPYERYIEGAPRILVAGDSTAYGTGVRRKEESIAGLIGSDFPSYTIENKSTNGLTTKGLLEKLEKLNNDDQYALILLQIGGNDILQKTDIQALEGDLKKVIELALQHTEHVVVMSSGNVGGAVAFLPLTSTRSKEYEAQTRLVRELFIQTTSAMKVKYIDLFKEHKDDVFITDPKTNMAFDGLHPSGKGYGVWYASLQPVVKQILLK